MLPIRSKFSRGIYDSCTIREKVGEEKEHKTRAVKAYLEVDSDKRPSMLAWWKDREMPQSAGNHPQVNSNIVGRYRVCWETFCKGNKA